MVVYFNVYNNGSGSSMWRVLDSAEVLGCTGTTHGQSEVGPVPAAPSDMTDAALEASQREIHLRDDVEQGERIVRVTSTDASIPWHAQTDASWLQLSAGDGQTPDELVIKLEPKGLIDGQYDAVVMLTSPHLADQQVEIAVTARVGDGYYHFLPLVNR